MEAQQSAKDSYVANLPAMSKSNDEVHYLFLVVNGANEVLKTEPFVVKARESNDVPSWQMVSRDESVQLFTEVPDARSVAASFSDSVSLNVVESGARFGLVAHLYGASGSATASGAAAGATNAGTASMATAGMSTVTIAVAAAAVAGVAAGGSKGGSSAAPVAPVTPTTPVAPVSNANPFAGIWTFTAGAVTCTGTQNFSTSISSGDLFVPTTGVFLTPTVTSSAGSNTVVTLLQYSGSVSTSGELRIADSLSYSAPLGLIIDRVQTGTLTKTGPTTGNGSGNWTATLRPPNSGSCSQSLTYTMR
jgi:hypothetical protein